MMYGNGVKPCRPPLISVQRTIQQTSSTQDHNKLQSHRPDSHVRVHETKQTFVPQVKRVVPYIIQYTERTHGISVAHARKTDPGLNLIPLRFTSADGTFPGKNWKTAFYNQKKQLVVTGHSATYSYTVQSRTAVQCLYVTELSDCMYYCYELRYS